MRSSDSVIALIHRSAGKGCSPKLDFRFTGFSEVRSGLGVVASLAALDNPSGKPGGVRRTGESMSAEENKAIMRRYFEGAWEQGNLELLDELLAADYVNHNPATPETPTGPEGVKGVVSMFRSGMPDLAVIIEDMLAEGEKVATRYTLEGTHGGELFGVPPTGKRLSIKSMTIERVSEGKIREHWRVTDTLGMMQQLGVVPEPGQQEGVEPSH
jgi:steroid delta-isomerase-like uncharacterized protein